ncbi:lysophospholipase [Adhaeribacter arboris]|uniref:Lysophospholipase n=1 Tax=Adhaeribacter arboris TaxID=2072846 RepID=A0A2T2Y960_9BACT|nr:SGNH/GDSL hydrolase family protein [Adhaeribacter arboris]PSR52047.1 lysophospholipase [Adhaeribacter arboris]
MKENQTNRRHFLKQISTLSALVAGTPGFVQAMPLWENNPVKEGDGFTFLFQGDSITDGNRTRNNDWNHVMGHGYAYIIASKLWYEYPAKKFRFFNRGISGNKVTDLAARWQTDTLDIKPDVLSILIGINDVSTFLSGNQDFSAEQYEKSYQALLQQTKQELPNVQLVLGEPFILPVGKVKEKWAEYSREVQKRREIVKKLSTEYQAILVGFQDAFNKALAKAPADYWIWDGIHPMPAGHELMAREWLKQVSKNLKLIKA